ncbi:putative MFS family arabinose efflux permease [Lacrimispora xylanisolvens]|uniref:Putative MFS family arabinose efflux permease n=1 Tax=Lacrimispora xylanisolvens TaxID=384636 RepID=A0A2S6HYV5_9FIRM|nr:MFS transporter [Hungatella xylanolytica]PPK83334.1 putative MFS family arabinose efflux permease [Hungatella xylanolytica]
MFKGNIKTVIGILFLGLISMGAMAISAGLSSIAAAYPDVSIETIQTLITIPALVIVVVSFLSGPIANVISKKTLSLIALCIFTAGGCIPFFSDSFTVLYLSRLLVGLGIGLLQPLSQAIIFESFADAPSERDTILGWLNSSGSVGSIIMTIIGGIVVVISYKYIFLVHLLGLAAFFGVLFCLPQDQPVRKKKEGTAGQKMKLPGAVFYWYAVIFVYMTFLHCFAVNLSLFVEGEGIGTAAISGIGLSMLTIGGFVCGAVYGKIANVLKKWTLPAGFLLSALGLLSMAIAYSPVLVYVSGLLTGVGMMMVFPQIITNIISSVSPAAITLCIAINGAVVNIGQTLAPYVVTRVSYILAGDSVRGRYYVCTLILMLVFAVSAVRTIGRRSPGDLAAA